MRFTVSLKQQAAFYLRRQNMEQLTNTDGDGGASPVSVSERRKRERFTWRETPLHMACSKEGNSTVRRLIAEGADVSAKGEWGKSPLHYTVKNQSPANTVEILKTLLEAGLSVNQSSGQYLTPLNQACCEAAHPDVIKFLICQGADVNIGDDFTSTPMHHLEEYVDMDKANDVVRLLLEAGADIDSDDANGDIPLSKACTKRNIDLIRLLLTNGADPNFVDYCGVSLFQCICECTIFPGNMVECIQLLIKHGADERKLYCSNGGNCHICDNLSALGFNELCKLGVLFPTTYGHKLDVIVVLGRAGWKCAEALDYKIAEEVERGYVDQDKKRSLALNYLQFSFAVDPYWMPSLDIKDGIRSLGLVQELNLFCNPKSLKTHTIHAIRKCLLENGAQRSILPEIETLGGALPPAMCNPMTLTIETDNILEAIEQLDVA